MAIFHISMLVFKLFIFIIRIWRTIYSQARCVALYYCAMIVPWFLMLVPICCMCVLKHVEFNCPCFLLQYCKVWVHSAAFKLMLCSFYVAVRIISCHFMSHQESVLFCHHLSLPQIPSILLFRFSLPFMFFILVFHSTYFLLSLPFFHSICCSSSISGTSLICW